MLCELSALIELEEDCVCCPWRCVLCGKHFLLFFFACPRRHAIIRYIIFDNSPNKIYVGSKEERRRGKQFLVHRPTHHFEVIRRQKPKQESNRHHSPSTPHNTGPIDSCIAKRKENQPPGKILSSNDFVECYKYYRLQKHRKR